MRYGASLLRGERPQSGTARGSAPQSSPSPGATRAPVIRQAAPPARPSRNRLDRSYIAKDLGGDLARGVGNAAGVVQGVWHAAEGLGQGAVFLGRLASPLIDERISAPGQTAADQLVNAGKGVIDYAKKGVENPRAVWDDVQARWRQLNVDLDPRATPVADTFSGELRRNYNIGRNQGEAVVEVGSLAVGGPLAKTAGKIGVASKMATPEKYLAQGFSPKAAAYLAEPYEGMGHHFVPRRVDNRLGLSPVFSESEFNVLMPSGISRGDFYEQHFKTDPKFNSANLPREVGGGTWRGKVLGLEKYSRPGRLWHGSPGPLKARIGGLGIGAGGLMYGDTDAEEQR